MKETISILCLSCLVVSQLSAQEAPWEKTAGPPGLGVNVIYETNSILYAGTETQGVYKSTDNGLNWVTASNGIERSSVSAIIVSNGNLLAAVASACPNSVDVFKSTDNGATWTPTSGLTARVIRSFAIKGSLVYAVGGFGFFRSSDNGNTWEDLGGPIRVLGFEPSLEPPG